MSEMIRTQIYLSSEQHEQLKRRCEELLDTKK
ncbi:MAG: hypothetical protein ACI8V2_001832 [Candidatus Latescibacterota bacterium]|jgi:hypothetical protein